jgi:hypothetical protein
VIAWRRLSEADQHRVAIWDEFHGSIESDESDRASQRRGCHAVLSTRYSTHALSYDTGDMSPMSVVSAGGEYSADKPQDCR